MTLQLQQSCWLLLVHLTCTLHALPTFQPARRLKHSSLSRPILLLLSGTWLAECCWHMWITLEAHRRVHCCQASWHCKWVKNTWQAIECHWSWQCGKRGGGSGKVWMGRCFRHTLHLAINNDLAANLPSKLTAAARMLVDHFKHSVVTTTEL